MADGSPPTPHAPAAPAAPPARLRDLASYLREHRRVLGVALAVSLLGARADASPSR